MRNRRQRRDRQRRLLLSFDGEETRSGSGNCDGESFTLHLLGRLGRCQLAQTGRRLPGQRTFRENLLQSSATFG